jgi:hypothetical protein
MPVLLPTAGVLPGEAREQLKLQGPSSKQTSKHKERITKKKKPAIETTASRGLRFGPLPQAVVEKPKREKQPKLKNDPKHVAAARELRDRYLEQFNSGLLLGESSQGKYAVGRMIEERPLRAARALAEAA